MSLFQGMEPQPIIQLVMKLFEREMWLLLGPGWMTLLSGRQKCFCSITHILPGKELQRGRIAETIRRLMRIPWPVLSWTIFTGQENLLEKKINVIHIFCVCKSGLRWDHKHKINNILSEMKDSRKIILKRKDRKENLHCVHELDILLFMGFLKNIK